MHLRARHNGPGDESVSRQPGFTGMRLELRKSAVTVEAMAAQEAGALDGRDRSENSGRRAINTDLVARVKAPAAGETVTGNSFEIFGGGKGANQAVAASRSGAAVAMLGAVGLDDFGAGRLQDLNDDKITTHSVSRPSGYSSGVALITVEESGQNRIAYVPGATWSITPDQALAAFNSWNPVGVLTTLELPHTALEALYREARSAAVPVICNATPEPTSGKSLALFADILIVNETEAMELLGLDSEPGDWVDVSRKLVHSGPPCVVITLGSSGALVSIRTDDLVIAAMQVGVVDTTGAGDAFLRSVCDRDCSGCRSI